MGSYGRQDIAQADLNFVDTNSRTYRRCPPALTRRLEPAEREDQLLKSLVLLDPGGRPCDMQAIGLPMCLMMTEQQYDKVLATTRNAVC